MQFQVNKIDSITNYLNQSKNNIQKENQENAFKMISNSLWVLRFALENPNTTDIYPESDFVCHVDNIVRYIDSLSIPKEAAETNRVFKMVVMKELQQYIGPKEIVKFTHHNSIDYKSQASEYELIAAGSLDKQFIVHNLLCALSRLRMAYNDDFLSDIQRIEKILNVLTAPMELSYAFRYLFQGFKMNSISFSIHHSRFIEVLTDLRETLKKTPSEEAMAQCIKKWVDFLK